MQDIKPLLTDDQAERLIESLVKARTSKGLEVSEEEALALCQWATLTMLQYISLQLLLNGEVEISDFKGEDDITFTSPELAAIETPLGHEIMNYVNSKFNESGG